MFILNKLIKFKEVKKIVPLYSATKAGFLDLCTVDSLGQILLRCGWLSHEYELKSGYATEGCSVAFLT